MEDSHELLRSYMHRLGFDVRVADIYQVLRRYGPQTISEVARNAKLERIHIYRLLDELKKSGLVAFDTHYKRSILRAAPIAHLQVLLSRREQELKDLQQDYDVLERQMTSVGAIQSEATRVQFYEGIDGIKQMLWSQTKAKGETVSILYDNMQHKTNLAFFERWVRKCNDRNLVFRGIIGDHFIRTQQAWYGTHSNERLKNWTSRYVNEKEFPVPYSLVVFDDVVLNYDWNGERMFGIAIQDQKIARLQRQFFELLWQKTTPVDDLKGLK